MDRGRSPVGVKSLLAQAISSLALNIRLAAQLLHLHVELQRE